MMTPRGAVSILLLLSAVVFAAGGISASGSFSSVFTAGIGGYACYRIPALLRLPNSTLLAFSEGRRFSCADHGWNDIVQRSSHDGGATWGALSVVYGESSRTLNVTIGNPAPAVLSADGRALLMPFCRENREVGLVRSEDGGSTWSLAVRSIAVPPGTWTSWVATGPPGSVRLAGSGRIVVAMNFANATVPAASAALLSDDGGATWRLSAGVVRGGNENQVAPLPWRAPAGQVLHMTMRNAAGSSRLASESTDGGESWAAPWQTVGPEDACEGSVVALPSARRLAMSSAFDRTKRLNMTLHVSRDDGRTWTAAARVWPGPAAYSSVVDAGAGGGAGDVVGLLFEKGDAGPYEQIAYVSVPL